MGFCLRLADQMVGRGRWKILEGDFENEVVWKIEEAYVFGCGRRCGLFVGSVSGSDVTEAHLQQLLVLHEAAIIVSSALTSP